MSERPIADKRRHPALSADVGFAVIAGAPKSATTAIAEMLRAHPDVLFSIPKEPYWFGTELAPLRHRQGLSTWDDYGAAFLRRAKPDARLLAEGSTLYMSSGDAMSQLCAFRPDARIICALRNPVDLAYAFHQQMVFSEFEPVAAFEDAWRLQERRRHDNPSSCPVPRLVQYGEIASIGSHLVQAVRLFGRERVHAVIYDEFAHDPLGVSRDIARFLDIDSEGVRVPPVVNQAMAVRWRTAERLVHSRGARRVAHYVKARWDSKTLTRLNRTKEAVIRKPSPRTSLRPAFRDELIEYFTAEVRLLEATLSRDLSAWRGGDDWQGR